MVHFLYGPLGTGFMVHFFCIHARKKMIEFKKFTNFPRGTMYDIFLDAYSFDKRNMG